MNYEEQKRAKKGQLKKSQYIIAFASMFLIMFAFLMVMEQTNAINEERMEERQEMVDNAAEDGRLPPKSAMDPNHGFEEVKPLYILQIILLISLVIPMAYLRYAEKRAKRMAEYCDY